MGQVVEQGMPPQEAQLCDHGPARPVRQVEAAVPSALVTGCSQALTSLTAWARKELIVFGCTVSLIILMILAFVYRNAQFWLLHAISLKRSFRP